LGLITISLIRIKKIFDYYGLIWIGFSIINFLSYTMVKFFWVNWDDSFNRVLLQVVPIFVFAMADNIVEIIAGNDNVTKTKIE